MYVVNGIDLSSSQYGELHRREIIRTYLPTLIASVFGVSGTILGVVIGWHLGSL